MVVLDKHRSDYFSKVNARMWIRGSILQLLRSSVPKSVWVSLDVGIALWHSIEGQDSPWSTRYAAAHYVFIRERTTVVTEELKTRNMTPDHCSRGSNTVLSWVRQYCILLSKAWLSQSNELHKLWPATVGYSGISSLLSSACCPTGDPEILVRAQRIISIRFHHSPLVRATVMGPEFFLALVGPTNSVASGID